MVIVSFLIRSILKTFRRRSTFLVRFTGIFHGKAPRFSYSFPIAVTVRTADYRRLFVLIAFW